MLAGEVNIIHQLKEAGCGFVSLGDSWCDTTNEMGRFMLTVMSGIAELERDLIRKRCQAGIERAKAKGTKFGRTSVLDASQRRKIAERYADGETMALLGVAAKGKVEGLLFELAIEQRYRNPEATNVEAIGRIDDAAHIEQSRIAKAANDLAACRVEIRIAVIERRPERALRERLQRLRAPPMPLLEERPVKKARIGHGVRS